MVSLPGWLSTCQRKVSSGARDASDVFKLLTIYLSILKGRIAA